MSLFINHSIRFKKGVFTKDGQPIAGINAGEIAGPEDVYRAAGQSYLKFFKMDELCKWGWTGAEMLLSEDGGYVYQGTDKTKIAVVLATKHGCLSVDKKYATTMQDIASPALFVYTLPNIVLGEIAIRHGFKGEQTCLVQNSFDADELCFWVNNLFENNGMEACLCGWVDAIEEHYDVCLFWASRQRNGINFSAANMQALYSNTF